MLLFPPQELFVTICQLRRPALFPAGWGLIALSFFTLAFAFTVRGSLSLALPLWQAEFGWSRSAISGIAAIALLVMATVAPFAGRAADRHGARGLLTVGLLAIGIGLVLVTIARPERMPWLLPLGFAGVAALGFGSIAQHVIAAVIAQRFDRNRGLATGIGTSGSTAGQLMLMPLLAATMQGGDWRRAFLLLAVGCLLLAPVALAMLRTAQPPRPIEAASPSSGDFRLASLVRNPAFQAIFWSYTICGFTTSGVIETHLMPYAALCGFPPLPSATAYGILSGVNLIGMILAGWLSDRVHRPRLLAAIYLLRAGSFILLLFVADSFPLLIVFAVMFGLIDYSTGPVTVSYVASRMGVRAVGVSMGILSAGHAVGGALGAASGGVLFDWSGSYTLIWLTSLMLALVAATLVAGLQDENISETQSPDKKSACLIQRNF
jgi:MFS family permease